MVCHPGCIIKHYYYYYWLIEKFDDGMAFGFYDRASDNCGHGLHIGVVVTL
jgi:hypothetical protein